MVNYIKRGSEKMETIKSLNNVIEKELMLKVVDDGRKLQELLVTAEEIYRNVFSVSAQYQDSEKNNTLLDEEVVRLSNNISRLKSALKPYMQNEEEKEINLK